MPDVHSTETRSYNMSRIRSMNTKPELVLRKALFAKGYRFRIHVKALPGKPDIVLKKFNTVIFIHGCFWHGHRGCKYFVAPKTRRQWWVDKIKANKQRDLIAQDKLVLAGWKVLEVFECDLKTDKREKTIRSVESFLRHQT